MSTVSMERELAHLAAIAPRPRRTTSEDWITNALFPSAPTPTSQSFAGDELIPGSAVPGESSDLRGALFEMSAGQPTGRWTYALVDPTDHHYPLIGREVE